MFGSLPLAPSPELVSRLNAEAAIAADTLFRQTGDPLDRLVLVVNPDGTYATETVRNKQEREQLYSQRKTTLEYVLWGVGGAGALYLLYRLLR